MVTIADTLIEEGMERGIRQGIQQGLQQGMLQSTREDVVEILKIRFPKVPRRLERSITRLHDIAALKVLHRKAAQVDSLEAFESFLNDMPK